LKEMALFMEETLTHRNLMPEDRHISRAFEILSKSDSLLDVLRFFHFNDNLCASLNIDNFEVISQKSQETNSRLVELNSMLDMMGMKLLVERWIENNCTYHDLEVIHKRIAGGGSDNSKNKELLSVALTNRSAYINFIYGNRINNIPLDTISRYKEDILIYAITNKKTAFIRLIEGNYELFSSLGSDSILFERDFYVKYININALNAKNLSDCGWMMAENPKRYSSSSKKLFLNALEDSRVYTFEEIKALYGLSEQYCKFYSALNISRVDESLKLIRQLSKRKLLDPILNDEDLMKLADMLSKKPLSAWRKEDLSHISELKAQDAVQLLIHWVNVKHLVLQMKTKADALLVLRNVENADVYDNLDDMKNDLIKLDVDWASLVKDMKLSDKFLTQNKEHIVEFLSQNGSGIAYRYFSDIDKEAQKEDFTRIVKAVLMGEFRTLKYHGDDLRKELDYSITDTQKGLWMNNLSISNSEVTMDKKASGFNGIGIEVQECDDFYSTMLLGITPQETCLSYINGKAKDCLLSSFDSNKKILYAYKDGKVVGRAIVRLTKGAFNDPSRNGKMTSSLSFVDLEKNNSSEPTKSEELNLDSKERLILFLERPYSTSVSDDVAEAIKAMYIELLSKKAKAMGAMLVLSKSYQHISADYVRANFYVYISKSKAGAQYLDSLNGVASVSDEGSYKSNIFYIHKDSM